MNESILTQIENSFGQLSISEQLWLIERLVHRVHEKTIEAEKSMEYQLTLMATDPNIQKELQKIEQDFACAESDGLETAG